MWASTFSPSIGGLPLQVTESPSPESSPSPAPEPSATPSATEPPSTEPQTVRIEDQQFQELIESNQTTTETTTPAPTSPELSTVQLSQDQFSVLVIGIVLIVTALFGILFAQIRRP